MVEAEFEEKQLALESALKPLIYYTIIFLTMN